MKTKSKELDVDFIGGQGSLTKDEEQKISEYLRNQKLLRTKTKYSATRTSQRRKVVA